jgi:hypothetical protein
MPMERSKLRQIHDCLDRMSDWMDQVEARRDAEEREELEEEQLVNPLEAPSNAPFNDGAGLEGPSEGYEDRLMGGRGSASSLVIWRTFLICTVMNTAWDKINRDSGSRVRRGS